MEIIELLPSLHMLRFPVGAAYLWSDTEGGTDALTLIDTGVAGSAEEIAAAVRGLGRDPADIHQVVLTHFHHDHTGSAAEIRARYGAAVLAHRREAPVIRGEAAGAPPVFAEWERALFDSLPPLPPAPPVPVDRELEDGDTIDFGGGAEVVWVPGHTEGSIALHLPGPRFLFTGDTAANVEGRTMPGVFNSDPAGALASFRRLAALDVDVACFGHGEPVTAGASAALRAAAGGLGD
ncbi:MBL fold metallo-hydrolase [Streptomyces sp. NBC_01198]|uniref:MBL fold metallo-hydrolase n=1 Tax=Streptomyces sp. NBC_01198 TaxID=2903769 RepID=UPI002E15F835|nr:MBL fold metallo-hydrolase [Streptomyces sp. NBC_01198]